LRRGTETTTGQHGQLCREERSCLEVWNRPKCQPQTCRFKFAEFGFKFAASKTYSEIIADSIAILFVLNGRYLVLPMALQYCCYKEFCSATSHNRAIVTCGVSL